MILQRINSSVTRLILFVTLIAGISVAHAHTGLKESVPADKSTVQTSPTEIKLVFNGSVRLVKFDLLAGGEKLSTGFKISADAVATFAIPCPELSAGSYIAEWAVISEDGHTVSNSFSFEVEEGDEGVAKRMNVAIDERVVEDIDEDSFEGMVNAAVGGNPATAAR